MFAYKDRNAMYVYIYIYMCVSFSMFDSGVVAVVGLL